jgi:hypothetical protein
MTENNVTWTRETSSEILAKVSVANALSLPQAKSDRELLVTYVTEKFQQHGVTRSEYLKALSLYTDGAIDVKMSRLNVKGLFAIWSAYQQQKPREAVKHERQNDLQLVKAAWARDAGLLLESGQKDCEILPGLTFSRRWRRVLAGRGYCTKSTYNQFIEGEIARGSLMHLI